VFAIWLAPVRLVGVDEAGRLVLAAARGTEGWLASRYGAVLAGCAAQAGHELRLASPVEIRALVPAGSGIEQSSLEVAG
jgi:hypothetical protein